MWIIIINRYENVFRKYWSKYLGLFFDEYKRQFYVREEVNTSNLLAFLDETERLLQQLINRDKQLKEIEMKVR